jgi:hypothetical protein
MSNELVDIDVKIHRETTEAILVSTDHDETTAVWTTDVWLPKTLIEIERKRGGLAVVTVPEWLALKEGLI